MLDKLLEDLKKKLPGAKKDQESEDEALSSEDAEGSEEEVTEEVSEVKEKKKSSPLIKIVIILAVGFLALDFLLPKDESTDINQVVQVPVVRKKKLKKDREKEANKEELASENSGTTKPEESKPEESQNEDSSKANISDSKTDEDLSKAIGDISIDSTASNSNTSEDLTKAPIEEINVLKNPESSDSSTAKENPLDGLGEGAGTKSETTQSSMESKIAEQAVYVDPPKYEILGRGLVYNCKGKHWACVDKANYQICHKNMKFNSENGKPSECVTQNVYANEEDCGTVQRYNVSTNVSTAFCK